MMEIGSADEQEWDRIHQDQGVVAGCVRTFESCLAKLSNAATEWRFEAIQYHCGRFLLGG